MKRETKNLEKETHPGEEGVMKEKKFLQKRKPSHRKGQWGALESKTAA